MFRMLLCVSENENQKKRQAELIIEIDPAVQKCMRNTIVIIVTYLKLKLSRFIWLTIQP